MANQVVSSSLLIHMLYNSFGREVARLVQTVEMFAVLDRILTWPLHGIGR